MEYDVRQDALDVLRDALSWRLPEEGWAAVERAVNSLVAALSSGKTEAFAEATYLLELAGPIRARSAQQAEQSKGVSPEVRVRIAEIIHRLDGQPAGGTPSARG